MAGYVITSSLRRHCSAGGDSSGLGVGGHPCATVHGLPGSSGSRAAMHSAAADAALLSLCRPCSRQQHSALL